MSSSPSILGMKKASADVESDKESKDAPVESTAANNIATVASQASSPTKPNAKNDSPKSPSGSPSTQNRKLPRTPSTSVRQGDEIMHQAVQQFQGRYPLPPPLPPRSDFSRPTTSSRRDNRLPLPPPPAPRSDFSRPATSSRRGNEAVMDEANRLIRSAVEEKEENGSNPDADELNDEKAFKGTDGKTAEEEALFANVGGSDEPVQPTITSTQFTESIPPKEQLPGLFLPPPAAAVNAAATELTMTDTEEGRYKIYSPDFVDAIKRFRLLKPNVREKRVDDASVPEYRFRENLLPKCIVTYQCDPQYPYFANTRGLIYDVSEGPTDKEGVPLRDKEGFRIVTQMGKGPYKAVYATVVDDDLALWGLAHGMLAEGKMTSTTAVTAYLNEHVYTNANKLFQRHKSIIDSWRGANGRESIKAWIKAVEEEIMNKIKESLPDEGYAQYRKLLQVTRNGGPSTDAAARKASVKYSTGTKTRLENTAEVTADKVAGTAPKYEEDNVINLLDDDSDDDEVALASEDAHNVKDECRLEELQLRKMRHQTARDPDATKRYIEVYECDVKLQENQLINNALTTQTKVVGDPNATKNVGTVLEHVSRSEERRQQSKFKDQHQHHPHSFRQSKLVEIEANKLVPVARFTRTRIWKFEGRPRDPDNMHKNAWSQLSGRVVKDLLQKEFQKQVSVKKAKDAPALDCPEGCLEAYLSYEMCLKDRDNMKVVVYVVWESTAAAMADQDFFHYMVCLKDVPENVSNLVGDRLQGQFKMDAVGVGQQT